MQRRIQKWAELTHDNPFYGWWSITNKHRTLYSYVHFPLEFQILLKGSTRINSKLGARTLKPGDVAFIGPWEPHHGNILTNSIERVCLVFLPVFLYGSNLPVADISMPFFSLRARRFVQEYDNTARKNVLMRACMIRDALEEKSPFGNLLARLDTQRLLLDLTRNVGKLTETHNDMGAYQEAGKILQVIDFVKSRIQGSLRIADAAAHVNLSRTNFVWMFKEITGQSFAKFVLQARLETARERLMTTNDKVSAIAAELGFSDASHLTRYFKKRFGKTPGQMPRGQYQKDQLTGALPLHISPAPHADNKE